MLPKPDAAGSRDLAHLIAKQIKSAENIRHLGRLPGLEVEPAIPTEFLQLLGKLHHAESGKNAPKGGKRKG